MRIILVRKMTQKEKGAEKFLFILKPKNPVLFQKMAGNGQKTLSIN